MKKTLLNDGPKRFAVCLGGANACPPEDVGGPYGYVEYVKAITNENHPEHEDMLEWGYENFDPTKFDAEQTNDILKTIKT